MKTTVRVEGLKELDDALGELSRGTARNILRRVGIKALQPVADMAKSLAPVDDGHLRDSIGVGTKLTRRQAGLHKKAIRTGASDANFAEVFAGAGGLPQATQQEFGNAEHGPQPFLTPAWNANKGKVLDIVKTELRTEIDKAAARVARKAARLAAKG